MISDIIPKVQVRAVKVPLVDHLGSPAISDMEPIDIRISTNSPAVSTYNYFLLACCRFQTK
jgi:hypothetical protein